MWAVAQRMPPGTTAEDVGVAFDAGEIVRTHAMRPTWHFLAPDELRWIQALTGPRVRQGNAALNRRAFHLTDEAFATAISVIREELSGGRTRTRDDFRAPLAAAGIDVDEPIVARLPRDGGRADRGDLQRAAPRPAGDDLRPRRRADPADAGARPRRRPAGPRRPLLHEPRAGPRPRHELVVRADGDRPAARDRARRGRPRTADGRRPGVCRGARRLRATSGRRPVRPAPVQLRRVPRLVRRLLADRRSVAAEGAQRRGRPRRAHRDSATGSSSVAGAGRSTRRASP